MLDFEISDVDFDKMGGLVPAIVQDHISGLVLMLGFMNAPALEKTIETGLTTFYSRTRNCLWTKGETSGNHLLCKTLHLDCDNDSLLVMAEAIGPTCHTGSTSCFSTKTLHLNGFLQDLDMLIEQRKSADTESSYTSKLLNGPLNRCAQKVGEEGVETALAAVAEADNKFVSEAADLLYHLIVLSRAKSIPLSHIISELKSRHT